MEQKDRKTEYDSLLQQLSPSSLHRIPHKRIKYEVSHSKWKTSNIMRKREISKKCKVQGQYLNKRQVKRVFSNWRSEKLIKKVDLDFTRWKEASKAGLGFLSKGISLFVNLQDFKLSFSECFNPKEQGLKYLSLTLGRLKRLEKLDLDFVECYNITSKEVKYIGKGLGKLRHLWKLNISFSECELIDDKGLRYLSNSLKRLDSLVSLGLNFAGTGGSLITSEGLRFIFENLSKLQNLRDFNLSIYMCPGITDQTLKDLNMLTLLRHLDLDITSCEQITKEGIQSLSENLKKFVSLQHLKLQFMWLNVVDDECVGLLINSLNELAELRSLHLDFSSCKEITNEGMRLFGNGLIRLGNLQNFSLTLNSCAQINSEGFTILSQSLRELGCLHSLHLDFGFCEANDDVIKALAQSLEEIQSLQQIVFHLHGCDGISNEGIKFLCEGVQRLPLLISLFMNLSNSKISLEGYQTLSKALKDHGSIQDLTLSFGGYKRMNNQGLECFSHAFGGLVSSLKKLSLNFRGCADISNGGLKHLMREINTLKDLQSLKILFPQCNIMDEELETLSKGLLGLNNLENLSFNFSYCKKLGNQGVKSLSKVLPELDSLKQLNFGFSNCATDREGLKELDQSIRKINLLEHVRLVFPGGLDSIIEEEN